MPTVSVIIPTYNHANYVAESIESVLSQTYKDYELIIVNDGSPDDTEEVLQPYIHRGQIRYICQENQGQASARNRGLSECQGKYVAFLDDDDLWPMDKLQWQVEYLEANSQCNVVGGAVVMLDNNSPRGDVCNESGHSMLTYAQLFYGNPFNSPGQVLIRKSALEGIGGFDTSIWGADDFDVFLRLAELSPIASFLKTALYYRLHSSNASRNHLRMLQNSRTCMLKNARRAPWRERYTLKRRGFRWLHAYAVKILQGRGTPVRMLDQVRVFSLLVPGIFIDHRLIGDFYKNWIAKK